MEAVRKGYFTEIIDIEDTITIAIIPLIIGSLVTWNL